MDCRKRQKRGVILSLIVKFFKWLKDLFTPDCGCDGSGGSSGSGRGATGNNKNIKLVRGKCDVIGRGFHRSGWPYACWRQSVLSGSG